MYPGTCNLNPAVPFAGDHEIKLCIDGGKCYQVQHARLALIIHLRVNFWYFLKCSYLFQGQEPVK